MPRLTPLETATLDTTAQMARIRTTLGEALLAGAKQRSADFIWGDVPVAFHEEGASALDRLEAEAKELLAAAREGREPREVFL